MTADGTPIIPYSTPWAPGMVISKPGIFSRVPMHIYHSGKLCDGPSISSGGLRTIEGEDGSPAHYWCTSYYNPDGLEEEETEAMTLGRAAHHLLLGESDFSTEYVVRPEELFGKPWHGGRGDCKKWLRDRADYTVLKPSHLDAVRGMARELAKHPLVRDGILNGAIEQTFVWRCKETGVWKKARPDAVPNDSGDFVDLKTVNSVHTHALSTMVHDFGYHMQGAMICEGWHALTGSTDSTFTLVCVEKNPPHCVRIVSLWDADLARGEQLNTRAVKKFAHGMATGEWPGPGGADAEPLGMPEWAQKQIDRRLELAEKEQASDG